MLPELIEKIATEPARDKGIEVRVPSPELRREMLRGGNVVSELLADPRHTLESRTFRTGHVLGPPATPEALADWQRRWPRYPLPTDLRMLISQVDGIHLWADLDTGRSYEGLAPLQEWEPARTKMYGPDAEEGALADKYLAISYHSDGATFVVLDVETGGYFDMDACGADESQFIGDGVEQLLEWLWERRIP